MKNKYKKENKIDREIEKKTKIIIDIAHYLSL